MDYKEAPWGKREISLYMAFLYRQETETWRGSFMFRAARGWVFFSVK